MEYEFRMTSNGPVVVTESEVVFFHEYGVLQEIIDSDADFFDKAFEFLKVELNNYAELAIEQGLNGETSHSGINRFQSSYGAAQSLKNFEKGFKAPEVTVGFPGGITLTTEAHQEH